MNSRCLIKPLILFVLFQNYSPIFGVFKLTNYVCLSYNKTIAIIRECRLRAVSRDMIVLNSNVTLLKKATVIHMGGALLKKYNGYKPFLVNGTIDVCEYLEKPNNPVANLIYKQFKDFSNFNHTCPYYPGDLLVRGFYLRTHLLNSLPLPNGEYQMYISWLVDRILVAVTKIYFVYDEEERKSKKN